MTNYWHVIGGEHVTGDLAGVYQLMVLGPTPKGNADAIDLSKFVSGPPMEHLAVLDHEPDDFEKDQLQPLAFRDLRPNGKPIQWDSYEYDDALDCAKAGDHLQSVDEDGYCNRCGHPDPNPEAPIEAAIASIQGDRDEPS